MLNIPTESETNRISNERLKEFEGKISVDNNDYIPSRNTVEDNIFNKSGKKIEDVIDDGFDVLFGIVKGFIDDK